MVVVLDSEYLYTGIIEWSPIWKRHGWRVKNKGLGHRDQWEAIWQLRQDAGPLGKFIWTPSHLNVQGNDNADEFVEQGRLQHPNDKKRRSEEPPEAQRVWTQVRLHPMRWDVPLSAGGSGSDTASDVAPADFRRSSAGSYGMTVCQSL